MRKAHLVLTLLPAAGRLPAYSQSIDFLRWEQGMSHRPPRLGEHSVSR